MITVVMGEVRSLFYGTKALGEGLNAVDADYQPSSIMQGIPLTTYIPFHALGLASYFESG